MTEAVLTRSRDRPGTGDSAPAIDPGPLLGDWVAFKPAASLTRVLVEADGGATTIRAFEAEEPGTEADPTDWGEAPARVFAGDVDGGRAWGFRGSCDLGTRRVELYAYENRGLLVVEAATTFADGEPRSPHYVRYMFHRAEELDE